MIDSELRVPADDAFRAIQLLNASESIEQPATATANCPECGSFETRTVPPYAHMFAAAVAAGVFLAAWSRSPAGFAIVLVLLVAGVPVWQWLARLSGKQKCRKCGWMVSG